jgi:hypothetical protein
MGMVEDTGGDNTGCSRAGVGGRDATTTGVSGMGDADLRRVESSGDVTTAAGGSSSPLSIPLSSTSFCDLRRFF